MTDFSEKEYLLSQYEEVKQQIIKTCSSVNRKPEEIKLIVISKFQPDKKIRWLLEAGQRQFGESRVEELQQKWGPLLSAYPDIKLHYIGQIQSRKIQQIVKYCHTLHSLDRLAIAEKIARECAAQDKTLECLVQINTGAEEHKGGIDAQSLPTFLQRCLTIHPLLINGIMCIPPIHQDPVPHFQLMLKLKSEFHLHELSMGMSNDYSEAISCGATMLRIGSKIMGPRSVY